MSNEDIFEITYDKDYIIVSISIIFLIFLFLAITDEMRVVTAKGLFFAAVGREHEYSANIEDFLINKIKHLLKSEYFYLEKKSIRQLI